MKLSAKDKLAIQRLLSTGQVLSNISFNAGQKDGGKIAADACRAWDGAYLEAKIAIRKLQLPPF